MTLLRIDLVSLESQIEITSGERVFAVTGGDHLNLELQKVGDSITIKLIKTVEGADKFRGVPQNREPDFPIQPESPRAGTSVILNDGREFYQGKAKPSTRKPFKRVP